MIRQEKSEIRISKSEILPSTVLCSGTGATPNRALLWFGANSKS